MKIVLKLQRDILLWTRCDYMFGTDWSKLKMVGIRDMHNYS